ncbi:MAG: TerB family tellurite resistance protein, partial [Myxococcales bacterium]
MPNSHDRFNIEVLKLLLKLAWQDGELAEREQLAIFALGRSWTVPEAELTTLREQLKSGTALPEPDLETLKE